MTTASLAPPSTARPRAAMWAFIVTSIALFMVSLDNLVVTMALPAIRKELHAGIQGLEWTVNAYTLTFAVLLLTGATLGERFGRRRLFVDRPRRIFTLASAAAALAPNIDALIAARAVQGVGGAIIVPLTLTLLSTAVPPEKRGAGARRLGCRRRSRHRDRPAGRRRGRRGRVVAVDLLAERADRRHPRAAGLADAGREPRTRHPARPAGRRPGQCRPVRHRPRRHPRQQRRLDQPRGADLADPRHDRSSVGFVAWELRSRAADAADAAVPQPRLQRHQRWPACSCSSGCSARSSCWRSSCRPCRATPRSSRACAPCPGRRCRSSSPRSPARCPTGSVAARCS